MLMYVLEAKSQRSRCGLDLFVKLVDGCLLSPYMVIPLCFSIQISSNKECVYTRLRSTKMTSLLLNYLLKDPSCKYDLF